MELCLSTKWRKRPKHNPRERKTMTKPTQAELVYDLGYLHGIRLALRDLKDNGSLAKSPELSALAQEVNDAVERLNNEMMKMAERR